MKTHAVIPFAVLEAVRAADLASVAAEFGESEDLSTVRLGRSPTVTAQIAKFESLARRGVRVDTTEVGGIIKLIGRRRDADLVMAEAGRRAGKYAAEWYVSRFSRLVLRASPGALKRRLGARIAKRAARTLFEVELGTSELVSWDDAANLNASSGEAKPCEVFRAATAEMLRRLTSFDGALFHVSCYKNGEDRCVWTTEPRS